MLGFILSKMDLLILVTAILAIVGFFSFGLVEITKSNEAGKLVSRLKEASFAFASSPSYCFSDSYSLPDIIAVAGNDFYYIVKISKQTVETSDGEELNVLIFSVYPRTEIQRYMSESSYVPKAIAASSFRTNANIRLFSQNYEDLGIGLGYDGLSAEKDGSSLGEEVLIDPQAVVPANTLEFVKEIENGKSTLFVIVCNSSLCSVEKTNVGEIVHPSDATAGIEGGFSC